MAALETTTKIGVSMKLDNGTSSSGAQKTVSVSFPTLSLTSYDADKVKAIADLVSACQSRTMVSLIKTTTQTITEGE